MCNCGCGSRRRHRCVSAENLRTNKHEPGSRQHASGGRYVAYLVGRYRSWPQLRWRSDGEYSGAPRRGYIGGGLGFTSALINTRLGLIRYSALSTGPQVNSAPICVRYRVTNFQLSTATLLPITRSTNR